MAHPERLELPTKWFEATYSIQLSYGCMVVSAGLKEAHIISGAGIMASAEIGGVYSDSQPGYIDRSPLEKYSMQRSANLPIHSVHQRQVRFPVK